jgi:hypothetical protein
VGRHWPQRLHVSDGSKRGCLEGRRGRDGPGRGVGWDGLWQQIGALLRWQFVCGSASLLSLMTGYDLRRPDHLDLYAATRASADDPWSAPVNLGAVVNTANNETRPSLSWDASTSAARRVPRDRPTST